MAAWLLALAAWAAADCWAAPAGAGGASACRASRPIRPTMKPITMSTSPDKSRPVQTYHQVPSRSPGWTDRMYQYQTLAHTSMRAPTVMYVRAERAAGLADRAMMVPP